MKNYAITLLLLISISTRLPGQSNPFSIYLEPVTIPGLPGLQAFAAGEYNGMYLLAGGRLDGLHRRQPWASFDLAGHNNQLILLAPVGQQVWTAPLSGLPASISEQLGSTNMEFVQAGQYLYVIGGYGYSATAGDHITFDFLTAIDLPGIMNAMINGNAVAPFIRQIQDPAFAVTGGGLNRIYSTYYLTGGQRFDGNYNPMNNPTFVQEYTNAIRKFGISDNGTTITISHHPSYMDSVNLHRRDFNVVNQIMPNGQEGVTAFSGVFQQQVDLPFLNSVNIDSSGYLVNNTFYQYYNHYHCARIPLYSETTGDMHTLFFGGIAQYYDSAGLLVQDLNVPFVKTIARVTRDASGTMSEYKLPQEMPSWMGASAEFLPLNGLPQFNNGVLKLDSLPEDTNLVGYIAGGINSTAANIFWLNTGVESSAGSQLFKVYILKNSASGTHQLNTQSKGTLHLQVLPNPNNGTMYISFQVSKPDRVKLTVSDMQGHILLSEVIHARRPGKHDVQKRLDGLVHGGVYYVTLETVAEKATQKVVID